MTSPNFFSSSRPLENGHEEEHARSSSSTAPHLIPPLLTVRTVWSVVVKTRSVSLTLVEASTRSAPLTSSRPSSCRSECSELPALPPRTTPRVETVKGAMVVVEAFGLVLERERGFACVEGESAFFGAARAA